MLHTALQTSRYYTAVQQKYGGVISYDMIHRIHSSTSFFFFSISAVLLLLFLFTSLTHLCHLPKLFCGQVEAPGVREHADERVVRELVGGDILLGRSSLHLLEQSLCSLPLPLLVVQAMLDFVLELVLNIIGSGTAGYVMFAHFSICWVLQTILDTPEYFFLIGDAW